MLARGIVCEKLHVSGDDLGCFLLQELGGSSEITIHEQIVIVKQHDVGACAFANAVLRMQVSCDPLLFASDNDCRVYLRCQPCWIDFCCVH
jgi:hypothetical protein